MAGITLFLVTGIMGINFFESFVIRHRWVLVFTSVLSAYVVVFAGKSNELCPWLFPTHWPFIFRYCTCHISLLQDPLASQYHLWRLCAMHDLHVFADTLDRWSSRTGHLSQCFVHWLLYFLSSEWTRKPSAQY